MGLTPVYGFARKGDGVAGVALGEGAGGGEDVGGTAGERVAGFVAEAVDSFGEGERFDAEAADIGGQRGQRAAGFRAAADSFGEGERFDAEAGEGIG